MIVEITPRDLIAIVTGEKLVKLVGTQEVQIKMKDEVEL